MPSKHVIVLNFFPLWYSSTSRTQMVIRRNINQKQKKLKHDLTVSVIGQQVPSIQRNNYKSICPKGKSNTCQYDFLYGAGYGRFKI